MGGLLVNALLAIGLLVLIVLVVYLVDRVNSLEKQAKRVAQMAAHAPEAQPDPWHGLSGKALWDAMSGRPPAQLSAVALQDMQSRYEVVLHKHIQSLFDEGVRDAQRGMSGEPKNPRSIQTAQGAVESWLPSAQVNTLYKAGMDTVQLPPEQWAPVRQALDEAGQLLFGKVQIALGEPLSQGLLPQAAPPAQAAPSALPGPDGQASQASPGSGAQQALASPPVPGPRP